MNIFYKRLLILFSVALNIGFIIMTVTTLYYHPQGHHKKNWKELTGIISRLALSEDREKNALECLSRFKSTMDRYDKDLKQARKSVILFLAESGPLDKQQLDKLIETVDEKEKIKRDLFEAHVIDLREKLGPEKGPMFFSLLSAGAKD